MKINHESHFMNHPSINEMKEQSSTHVIELSELRSAKSVGASILGGNLNLLHGVKVTLTAVVGNVQTTLGELMNLKESSVLKLDRPVDCPIDVMVDDQVIARGQLVAIDNSFGVRITHLAVTK